MGLQKEGIVTLCFDCQQNQPLPKLSVGEIFYSQQVWMYNCTVLQLEKDKKNKNIAHYTWLETQSSRGSNEIASALRHYIHNLENKLKEEKKRDIVLRLFSDSCCSQNKNTIMMATLMSIAERSNIFKKIIHFYPIRGHSFMPPDRVFGNIEKCYRKTESITVPSQYYKILNEHGKCYVLGEDWKVYDLKSKTQEIIKKKLPFKMNQVRVLRYVKNKVYVQTTYNIASCIQVECLKKEKTLKCMDEAEEVMFTNHVSQKKSDDIKKLLQYFDRSSEEARKFYEDVFRNTKSDSGDNNEVVFDEKSIK